MTWNPLVIHKPLWCVYCEKKYRRTNALAYHLTRKHEVPFNSSNKIAHAFWMHAHG